MLQASSMTNSLYDTISVLSSRVSGRTLPTMEPSWRSSSEFHTDDAKIYYACVGVKACM